MKKILLKIFLILMIVGAFGCTFYFYEGNFNSTETISGRGPVSLKDLQADYGAIDKPKQKVRILIVPGHEPDFGGTKFGGIFERNLVAETGQDLQQFFQANSNYQVFITRDEKSWNPTFTDYFKNSWDSIIAWQKSSKQNNSGVTFIGATSTPRVIHNSAPANVALRLYGITKWSNENDVDLMIHLHFNDYVGHGKRVAGKYSGMVIYTPAKQYSNSPTTKAVADAVFHRLSLYNPISNLPQESIGIIDDPQLIAVGVNNTSNAASILIEYDYIYEPQFVNPKVRSLALRDLAYQTYLGLQDFFTKDSSVTVSSLYNPTSIYAWNIPVTSEKSNPEDIYALQTSLIMDGDFPPIGKSRNDCPHGGILNTCTKMAVKDFQKKYSIVGEGVGGSQTFSLLHKIYINQ